MDVGVYAVAHIVEHDKTDLLHVHAARVALEKLRDSCGFCFDVGLEAKKKIPNRVRLQADAGNDQLRALPGVLQVDAVEEQRAALRVRARLLERGAVFALVGPFVAWDACVAVQTATQLTRLSFRWDQNSWGNLTSRKVQPARKLRNSPKHLKR